MKALSILALLAIGSPAFAAPAENQSAPAQDQKPFIYDSAVPLNGFSPPTPVTIGPIPAHERAPAPPPHPGAPAAHHTIELRRVDDLPKSPPPPKPAPPPGSDIG